MERCTPCAHTHTHVRAHMRAHKPHTNYGGKDTFVQKRTSPNEGSSLPSRRLVLLFFPFLGVLLHVSGTADAGFEYVPALTWAGVGVPERFGSWPAGQLGRWGGCLGSNPRGEKPHQCVFLCLGPLQGEEWSKVPNLSHCVVPEAIGTPSGLRAAVGRGRLDPWRWAAVRILEWGLE